VSLAPGARLEGYVVRERLGAGSFGVTYRVEDETLGLAFALKEYFPAHLARRRDDGTVAPRAGEEPAFRDGLARFLQEGRTLAALKHPNIVRVNRHFEANGTACLLMDLVEGRSLHELLVRSGPFSPAEVQALLGPLVDALSYLESRRVVHGDIKPSNVLVTREGAPVLLDFGAARVAHESGEAGAASAGSEGYAAVEQSLGEGGLGPWTDVYGLAATLYRLVTGDIPVASQRRRAALEQGEPDPLGPLTRRLAGPRDGFDPAFAAAVDRGLALTPDERPKSVEAWRAGFGPSVSIDRRPAKARRPAAEERVLLPPVLAAVAILALLATAAWVFLGGDAPGPGAREVAPSSLPDTSLAEDDDSWEQALRTDTAAGYRAYLEAFPGGRHAAAAREQLALFDRQRWNAVRDSENLADLEAYLEAFPDGRFVVEARARADVLREAEARDQARREAARRQDDAAFQEALGAGTVAALEDYLARFPGGANVAEALERRAALEKDARDQAGWNAARARDDKAAYEAYLQAFPDGLHLAEALAAVERLTLRPGKVFRDCPDCPEMVVVPPGSFRQGAAADAPLARSSEGPPRSVRIARPFAIGTREVSFREWDRCVAGGGCRPQPVDNGWGREDRPVMMVSWVDARAYVTWLSERTGEVYDLPSESQWEYVARAGETGVWAGGSAARVCDVANVAGAETGFEWRLDACADPFSVGTAPTGYFPANTLGVHDMTGNVAEWTRDCWNLSYLDAPSDGSAWERGLCSSRVTRGGSWFSGAAEVRLPARFPLRSGESNDFTGFRVVREVRP